MEISAESETIVSLQSEEQRVHPFSSVEQEVVELFDQFRDRLMRYLLSCSLTVHDAEDVIQDTFIALFRHLQSDKSRHHICGWLFRVAHNLALKHHRAQRDSKNAGGSPLAAINSAVCPAPNPEDQFLTGQREERVKAVLRALPEHQRWCLYLRAEGLRYREIAAVLDISLGSVALYLERSLAHIARAAER